MGNAVDLSLILPAYNERESIVSTIEQAFEYFRSRSIDGEIIVAADGADGTREKVREIAAGNPRVSVFGNEARCGKGRAVREAMARTRGRLVGYADADNKVPIEEFDKIRPCLDAGYQVVTGSRALAQSQIERKQPLYRRLGSAGFRIFLQTVLGLPGVHDTQCGFKFFHRDVALRLFGLQRIDGYMFDVEILTLAHQMGYGIKEVPIRWRNDGDSRLDLLSGNIRNVIDIFKIRSFTREADLMPVPIALSPDDD
jgi:dolichyl-phosphate beta-glucosyltransferase